MLYTSCCHGFSLKLFGKPIDTLSQSMVFSGDEAQGRSVGDTVRLRACALGQWLAQCHIREKERTPGRTPKRFATAEHLQLPSRTSSVDSAKSPARGHTKTLTTRVTIQVNCSIEGLALHPEVRFAWSWVGYPSRRPNGCGVQSPLGPKVYPKGKKSIGSLGPKAT